MPARNEIPNVLTLFILFGCCLILEVNSSGPRSLAQPPKRRSPPNSNTAFLQCAADSNASNPTDAAPVSPPPYLECPASSAIRSTPSDAQAGRSPPSLARVLVIVSFHWNLLKTVHLHSTLAVVEKYETSVDVIVNTDNVPAMRQVLGTWQFRFRSTRALQGDGPRGGPYQLLWSYHSLLRDAVRAANHTAFVYLEDDTLLPWATLVSWAIDTEVLAPLGFTRGIFRTEFHKDTGALLMMDVYLPMNLSAYPRQLDAFKRDPAGFCAVVQRYRKSQCPQRDPQERQPCTIHRHYVQVTNPFQGMWALTRPQVEQWMASPLWGMREALKATFSDIAELAGFFHPKYWGLPERSNAIPLVVGVPEGFGTNNVVPFEFGPGGRGAQLSRLAHVEHSRNGYALAPNLKNSKLLVARALCT